MSMTSITRARLAELEALVKKGIEIIEDERYIMVASYKEKDGVVRDYGARREIAKYDRWLKRARAQVKA